MDFRLYQFTAADATGVNQVALSAFQQYRDAYDDWEGFSARIANMAGLAESGELIVAKDDRRVWGAVAYFGPGREKGPMFAREWANVRMLVVDPGCRGFGIGRALMQACIDRAVRDSAPRVALHTSPIMAVAISMYARMGFRFEQEGPRIFGVPYDIYTLRIEHLAGPASPFA